MTTYKEQFNKHYGFKKNASHSKEDISRITGIPLTILNEVYDRGMGAWETNPRSVRIKGSMKKDPDLRKYPRSKRLSKYQWGMARVYSFIMKGKTFFTADKDLAIKAVQYLLKQKEAGNIPDVVRRGFNEARRQITKSVDYTKDKITTFFDSNKFNNTTNKYMAVYGNDPILKIELYRTPLPSYYQIVGDAFSKGMFSQVVAKMGYDNLFHLGMIVTVNHDGKPKKIVVEKNEEFFVHQEFPTNKDTETIDVPLNKNLTINELVNNTLDRIGTKAFFYYNSFSYNCQRMMLDMLTSNGLINNELKTWLYQDVAKLGKKLPKALKDSAQTAIEVKRFVNRITGKGAIPRKYKGIYDISKKDAIISYLNLVEYEPDKNKIQNVNYGMDMIKYCFFKRYVKMKTRRNISFEEFYNNFDDVYFKKRYVKNLYKYSLKNGKTRDKTIFNIFKIYFGGGSLFRPTFMKFITNKFKPKTVLDPTAGFGGRCLGCMSDNVNYIGIDSNKNLKSSYDEMLKLCPTKSKVKMIYKNSLDVDYSKYNYDLVLTSPPYFNIEVYEHMKKFKNKDDYYNNFLFPLIIKTYSNMKKGGHFCLNVKTEIYDEIVKYWKKANYKYPIVISPRGYNIEVKENIYIWKK